MADFDGPTKRVQPKAMASEEFAGGGEGSVDAVNPGLGTKSNQHTFLSATGVDHDEDDE